MELGVNFNPGQEAMYPGSGDIAMRRAILAAMLSGAMNQGGTQMAGRVAIRNSPLSAVAQMLTGAMAMKGLQGLNEQEQQALAPYRELQAMKLQQQRQALQDDQDYRNRVKQLPDVTAPTYGMASLAPTQANAAALEARQAPDQMATLKAQAQQFLQEYQKSGNPQFLEAAKKYADAMKLFQEKYSTTPATVMVNGRPTLAQFSESGGMRPVPGATPKPDYQQVNTNDRIQFYDPLTQASGGQFDIGMSPAEKDASKYRALNYGLAVNAEARAAANEGKPQLVTTNDGAIFGVNPKTMTGAPVIGPDGQPLSKGDKPLTEGQAKNSMYYGMMRSASERIDNIHGVKPLEIALARGDVAYVPQFVQNLASGEAAQKYGQASMQWAEAMLRITTGANAPEPEVIRVAKTYFPQVNDSPALMAQKAAARRQLEQFVSLGTGKGANQVNAVVGVPSAGGWSVTEIK